jgi:hypothetical protein
VVNKFEDDQARMEPLRARVDISAKKDNGLHFNLCAVNNLIEDREKYDGRQFYPRVINSKTGRYRVEKAILT